MAEGTYTVLARRFRPQGFADVVGQEHISQALRNAIRAGRVAHAYLFTGARGVGKTSTARILAKALNCPQAEDGNPCNSCEICDGISTGNDVDVLEIDGASNRGIDDIRQLRANVNVKSMRTEYKIYIIDEVHMLTKEAFNALLKTLEEPPPNVKFVFCTTEPNKVPDTILSRCQRFDFGTIETTNIKGRLGQIAQAEGVEVDDEALELVARRAAGSMRDSQSIFDQLLAFGEEHITSSDVHRLLGTAGDDRLIQIGSALVNRDQAAALAAFHGALDDGVQLGELTDQILFYLRDLMILASGAAKVDLLSVAPASRDDLMHQAEQWGLQAVVAAMQILADTKGRMQRVTYGRALAELALVRVALLEDLTDLSGLIEKLRSGETAAPISQKKSELRPATEASLQIKTHEEVPVTEQRQQDPHSEPVALGSEALDTSTELEADIAPVEQPVEPMVSESQGTGAVQQSESDQLAPSLDSVLEQTVESQPVVQSVTGESKAESSENSLNSAPGTSSASDSPPSGNSGGSEGLEVATDEVAIAVEASDVDLGTVSEFAFSPENADALWSQVVSEINDMLKSHVKQVSQAAILAPNKLELTFPRRYHFAKRFVEQPDAIRRIEGIASRLTGQQVRISLVVSEDPADSSPSKEAAASNSKGGQRVCKPEDDEFVAAVMETFSAECVRVDPIAPRIGDIDEEEGMTDV